MWSILPKRLLILPSGALKKQMRTFLSNAYRCQTVWERRRDFPAFQKIDYDDLYHQLDRSFQIGLRISALDVDLFVNGVDTDAYQNEIEDILFKLRLNPESSLLQDRTMHAVIRYYLSTGKKEEVLNILSNRLNYGIFPDYYVTNMLMDGFLKDENPTSAAKVAVLQMLQEDFNHPITRPLSIYSCLKYLNSENIWLPPKEPEVDPDEDEVKVRVMFIRQPYFDDHFDIVDTNHLIGKTLSMAGSEGMGTIGTSSQLLGLVLYEKWPAALEFATKVLEKKIPVHMEAVDKAIQFTNVRPKTEQAPPEDSEAIKKEKSELITVLEKLKSLELLQGDLEALASLEVSKAVQENESKDIEALTKLYDTWEKERADHLQQEIFESEKRKTMSEIEKTKESLAKEEEMVFFFDKEDEWELKVQQKQQEIDALAEQERKSKKKVTEEEYIPPDVHKRRV